MHMILVRNYLLLKLHKRDTIVGSNLKFLTIFAFNMFKY